MEDFDSSFFALADRLAGLRVRFAEGQREFTASRILATGSGTPG